MKDLFFDFKEMCNGCHNSNILDRDRLIVMIRRFLRLEFDVANVEDGRENGKNSTLSFRTESNHLHRLFQPGKLVGFGGLI